MWKQLFITTTLFPQNANGKHFPEVKGMAQARRTIFTYVYIYIYTTQIYTTSNHPPQIINMLPKSINERLSKNSSNPEIFDKAKIDYEKALKDSGYNSVNLTFNKPAEKQNRTRSCKVIWFNPSFNKSVTANVAK